MPAPTLRSTLLLLVLLLFLPGTGAVAQDISDPSIELDALQALLKPLTKAELEESAQTWISHVQGAERQVAQAVVAGDDPAKTEAIANRDGVEERANAVLDELDLKGGDSADYRTYLGNLTDKEGSGGSVTSEDVFSLATTISDWFIDPDGGIKWGVRLLLFLVILLAARVVSSIVGKLVRKAVDRLKNASSLLRNFFVNVVTKVTFFIGIVVALGVLGVDTGPFLAALGAAGFVIGFALQGTLSNFASGVMILVYRPYDLGDVVNAAGVTGKVDAMTLVSTTLVTPDNQVIVIPNGSIWGTVITNITARDTRRVDFVFGIGYGDSIEKAQSILEEILSAHPKVLVDEGITVKVSELADSSVNFVSRAWAKTEDYWEVFHDIQRQVKERFDAEGISIPFPQTDIHVHGLSGSPA